MNWSASFILNTPRDAFRQWADGALQPSMHSREIRLYETLSHGVADLHWTTEEDASWWIETYELGPERTEVTAWFDPRIDRWDLSLWTFILALDVIFTRFQDACFTLEWQPNDTASEIGAIFTGAMQRLRAGKAGVKGKGAKVPGNKASEIAARRHTILERWEHRSPGTTKEKFKRDTASDLAVSESTVRDDLRYWEDEGKIK